MIYKVQNNTNIIVGINDNPLAFSSSDEGFHYEESDLIFRLGDVFNPNDNSRTIAEQKAKILEQIKEHYDMIHRAVYELPAIKDQSTGQTWLQYRNEQILLLRSQYNALR